MNCVHFFYPHSTFLARRNISYVLRILFRPIRHSGCARNIKIRRRVEEHAKLTQQNLGKWPKMRWVPPKKLIGNPVFRALLLQKAAPNKYKALMSMQVSLANKDQVGLQIIRDIPNEVSTVNALYSLRSGGK